MGSLDEILLFPVLPLDPVKEQETSGGKTEACRLFVEWTFHSDCYGPAFLICSVLGGRVSLGARTSCAAKAPYSGHFIVFIYDAAENSDSLPKEPLSLCARATASLLTSLPHRERVGTGVVSFTGPLAGPECPVLGQTSV